MVNKLKKSGKTIILVLHDLSDAIRISDNLVIMNDRKIAISDTPANCLKHILLKMYSTQPIKNSLMMRVTIIFLCNYTFI